MQTIVSLILMLSGGFVAYGFTAGDFTYIYGGLVLSAVLLLFSIIDDVQTHERKKVSK